MCFYSVLKALAGQELGNIRWLREPIRWELAMRVIQELGNIRWLWEPIRWEIATRVMFYARYRSTTRYIIVIYVLNMCKITLCYRHLCAFICKKTKHAMLSSFHVFCASKISYFIVILCVYRVNTLLHSHFMFFYSFNTLF